MSSALLLSFLLVGFEPPADPRIELVELQAQQESRLALERTESLLEEQTEWSKNQGLDYLRGHLLDELGRTRAAAQAYVEAARSNPSLETAALVRVALNHLQLGHPEVAAGILAATLDRASSPRSADDAARLLAQSLAEGGDCGVLARIDERRLSEPIRRRLTIARIDCSLLQGGTPEIESSLIRLLQENQEDITAKNAADRLVSLGASPSEHALRITLGGVFHQHRDFESAVAFLEPVVVEFAPRLGSRDFDIHYQLVRSYFWNDDLQRAVDGYADLALRASRPQDRAKASYQLGRSYELLGRWSDASRAYRQAFVSERRGDFSGASLISALRVDWRTGHESAAADILETFPTDRLWRREYSRGLLFLASSDIVRGRIDRAGGWLEESESIGLDPVETAYWKGRLGELREEPEPAVRSYVEAIRRDAYHPLSQSALQRLRRQPLLGFARAEAQKLASSSQSRDLVVCWRILGHADPTAAQARRRLQEKLAASRSSRAFQDLAAVPAPSWPIWNRTQEAPEEKLLALGLWAEAEPVVLKHFPLSDLPLAYTASLNLAASGDTERSLYIAEVLSQRLPDDYPAWLLPYDFRRLLYPLAYSERVAEAGRRFDVDPSLMLSVFRQESRFNPTATSPASARGLAQFIYPTALRMGRKIGHWPLAPEDLEDPNVAIDLSAAYLAELGEIFRKIPHRMAAAYNAGERQARLWQSYCYSWEAEEFYTKIGFGETRSYVDRVLRNRAHYQEIYGDWWGGEAR